MKCSKCGAELEENIKFCTNCGSPVEEQDSAPKEADTASAAGTEGAASEQAEQGIVSNAVPVDESKGAVGVNAGIPEAAAPAGQTDLQPNKKFMKIVVAVIAAAAVISGAALAYMKMTAKDPKQVVIDAFANVYQEGQVYPVEELFGTKDFAETAKTADSETGLTLKMDSCSDASVNAFAGSGLRLEGKADKANNKNFFNMGVIYNGMDLANFNAYYGDKTLMVAIPELSKRVFTVDLGDGLADRIKNSPTVGPLLEQSGVDVDGLSAEFAKLIEESEKAQAEGKTPFDIKALLDRYEEGSQAQENFKAALTVTKAEKGVYVMDGKEVKCQGYDVIISKESMIEFLRSSSDFFLQDETLKADFLNQLETTVKMSEFMGGISFGTGMMSAEELQQQTYEEVKKAVDEMIAYLDKSMTDVHMSVYVDKKGRLAAFSGDTRMMEEPDTNSERYVDITFDVLLKGGAYLTQNADCNVTLKDSTDGMIDIALVKQGTYDGKKLTSDLSVDLTIPEDDKYNFVYTGTYDSNDGSYHVATEFGGNGTQYVKISSTGAVDQLEKGKSIHTNIDSLEISAMNHDVNMILSGEYYYQPLSEEVLPLEGEPMDMLAATESEWQSVMMEFVYGIMGLAGQLDIPMY